MGSTNGVLQVWDLRNRGLFRQSALSTEAVFPWAFVDGGQKLVISQPNDFLHEWDLTMWNETRSWPAVNNMMSLVFSLNEQWCLTFKPGVLREMTTGQEKRLTLQNMEGVNAAFSPDGKLIAVSSQAGSANLLETATLRQVGEFGGVMNGTHSVAFSPDGKRLATGSVGKEAIKLWDVESQQEVLTLEGQGSMFTHSAFSPDGNVLGSMNYQGVLHPWRAPSWAEIEAAETEGKKREE